MTELTKNGKSKRLVWILIIIAALIVGVGWTFIDKATAVVVQTTPTVQQSASACHPSPPDYPGCSYTQMKQLEAPNKRRMARNYDRARWGQTNGHEFKLAKMSAKNERHLKRLYNRAVNRFVARQHAKGVMGKSAYPRYRTWGGFVRNTDCGGSFGIYASMVSAWCQITAPINKVASGTKNIVIRCDGAFVAGSVLGAGIAWWGGVTIPPAALAGGGIAGAGCATENIWEKLTPW